MRINATIRTIKKIGFKRLLVILFTKYIETPFLYLKYKFFIVANKYITYEPKFNGIPLEFMLNKDALEYSSVINDLKNRKYRLFGVNFENADFNWNKDFNTQYVWKPSFYKRIKLRSFSMDKDPKFPLEFSRLNHLLILCLSNVKNEDKELYKDIIFQLQKWKEDNPLGFGMPWVCNMDVSLRAVNLVMISYFLLNDGAESELFRERELFNSLIYSHGVFIYDNLENKNVYNNNHYLSNLLGLLFVGVYFGNSKFGKKLLKFSIKELENEIRNQTNQDGTNFEGSTYYHKLAFEIFFYAMLFIEKNGLALSNEYKRILAEMYFYLKVIIKPNNEIPLLGDCDNGYVLNVNNYFSDYARKSISIIKIYEEYFRKSFNSDPEKEVFESNMYSFKEGGVYLIKSKTIYLLIRCGPVGTKGYGGHSHNDQLSFELNINGKDFFVDPGTAYYYGNHNIRNENRKTPSHNTLYYDKYEQNEFNEHDIFILKEQTFSICKKFKDYTFLGEHYGFLNKNGNVHSRMIKVLDNEIIIVDKLSNVLDEPKLSFILHPDVKIVKQRNGLLLINEGVKIFLEVENYSFGKSIYCYEYGYYQKTNRIIININNLQTSTLIKIV